MEFSMKRIRFLVVGHSNNVGIYNLANNVVNNLNSIQKDFHFEVHEQIISLPSNIKAPIPVKNLEDLVKKLTTEKYPREHPVVLCACKLEDDLFSSYDDKIAVITTHGWTKKFSPYPVHRYIVYSMVDILMTHLNVDTPVHDETKGCLGDYCDNKKDINIGLEKCDYCPDCHHLILTAVAKGSITLSQLAAIYKILDFAAGRKRCFVLMPFDKRFNPVYKTCIEPTLANMKWVCKRADGIFQPRDVMNLVWEEILKAHLIIADLTHRNANVFYELGYAHAFHKNTILITQSIEDVPFDLRQRQMVKYSPTPKGYKSLADSLKRYL